MVVIFIGIIDLLISNIFLIVNMRIMFLILIGMIFLFIIKWYVNNIYSKILKIWNNIYNIYCLIRFWGYYIGIFYYIDI